MMSVRKAGYHAETGHQKATKPATILHLLFNLATENVFVTGLHVMDSVQQDFHSVHLAILLMKINKYATMTPIPASTTSTMAIVGIKMAKIPEVLLNSKKGHMKIWNKRQPKISRHLDI